MPGGGRADGGAEPHFDPAGVYKERWNSAGSALGNWPRGNGSGNGTVSNGNETGGLAGILSGQLSFGIYIALALFLIVFALQVAILSRGGIPMLPTKSERDAEAAQQALEKEQVAAGA
mgnify:FL=1